MPSKRFKFFVGPNRTRPIELRELAVRDIEAIMHTMPKETASAGWDLAQEGVRRSLVSDDGKAVAYADVVGERLGERFTSQEMFLVRQVWERVHMPTKEQQEQAGEVLVIVVD